MSSKNVDTRLMWNQKNPGWKPQTQVSAGGTSGQVFWDYRSVIIIIFRQVKLWMDCTLCHIIMRAKGVLLTVAAEGVEHLHTHIHLT